MSRPKVVSAFETSDLLTETPEYGIAIFGNTELALFDTIGVKVTKPTMFGIRNEKPIGMYKKDKPRMI